MMIDLIRHSGRSFWQARYRDGRVISEWETGIGKIQLPITLGHTSRWESVDKTGMIGLRLLCPDGMAGELESKEDYKFFQLKCGSVGNGRQTTAHIIGVVINPEGDCICRAWETTPGRLIEFKDNIYAMKYQIIGRLNLEVQGLRI